MIITVILLHHTTQLGGVVTPHPGTCLMDQSNTDRVVEYVQDVKYVRIVGRGPLVVTCAHNFKSLHCILPQDYPSIGQLTDKLALYDILPIFAVTSEVHDLYSVRCCQQ